MEVTAIRSAKDVHRRAGCLVLVSLRAISLAKSLEGGSGAAQDDREWKSLKEEAEAFGARLPFSRGERRLLRKKGALWTPREGVIAVFQSDAAHVCLWALGIVEPQPWDRQVPPTTYIDLGDAGRFPVSSTRDLRMRSGSEIRRYRDSAETWLWRARTHHLMKDPEHVRTYASLPMPMTEVLAKIAAERERLGEGEALDGDMKVLGKPYRDCTDEEVFKLQLIAEARLRAANWICCQHRNWDKVRTDT